MNRKYLDELNITNRPDLWNPDDERQNDWKQMQEEYGFDERETWSLDYTWHLWLYERLKAFMDWGSYCIDLDFYKFEFKGKEYTQEEIINMILDRLKFEFKEDTVDSPPWNYTDEGREYVGEIEELWALVCHAMWW